MKRISSPIIMKNKKIRGLDFDDNDKDNNNSMFTIFHPSNKKVVLQVEKSTLTRHFPLLNIILNDCDKSNKIRCISFGKPDQDEKQDPSVLYSLRGKINGLVFFYLVEVLIKPATFRSSLWNDGFTLSRNINSVLDYFHASPSVYQSIRPWLINMWDNITDCTLGMKRMLDIYTFMAMNNQRLKELDVDRSTKYTLFRLSPLNDNPLSVIDFVRKISPSSDEGLLSVKHLFPKKKLDVVGVLQQIGGQFFKTFFSDFKQYTNKIVISGGSVVCAGCPTKIPLNGGMDVDLFVLADNNVTEDTKDDDKTVIHKQQNIIISSLVDKLLSLGYVVGTMGKSVVVGVQDGSTVQIIASPCVTKKQVIAAFDMDYVQCFVTSNGKDVIATTSCAESWATMKANPSNISRKLSLQRLVKAYLKGFDISQISRVMIDSVDEKKSLLQLLGCASYASIKNCKLVKQIKNKKIPKTTEYDLEYRKHLLNAVFRAKPIDNTKNLMLSVMVDWRVYGGKFRSNTLQITPTVSPDLFLHTGKITNRESIMMIHTCPLFIPFNPFSMRYIRGELFRKKGDKSMPKFLSEATMKTFALIKSVYDICFERLKENTNDLEGKKITKLVHKRDGVEYCDIVGKIAGDAKWFNNYNIQIEQPEKIVAGQWVKLFMKPSTYYVMKKKKKSTDDQKEEEYNFRVIWKVHGVTLYPYNYCGIHNSL